jgi:hypothetical protein
VKTHQLIDMLARNAGPAPKALAARRLTPAALTGFLVSAVLAVSAFGHIPLGLFHTHVPWTKLIYGGALVLAAGWLTAQLSRPGAPTQRAQRAAVAVVVVMVSVGALSLWLTPADLRWQTLRGHSWNLCPWLIVGLSMPALAATMAAVRGMAPTHPRQAGFAAGVLAGAAGACGYALACTESSPAFVAVWYSLGIVATGAIGAALGPRVLRW